jgi:hypothetical protein
MDAMKDGSEIGSSAAARIEDADSGTGKAEGLIELGAEKLINSLNHILHDFFRRIPNAKFLAEDGIKGFKEGLIKIGDGFIFAESIEKGGLNAIEGFTGEIENFLQLEGVKRAGFRNLAEELAEYGDAEIVGGEAPIEARIGRAAIWRATPENPGRENAVKKCLDEGGAEEMLALFAFKTDAKRFLQRGLDGIEAAKGMVFSTGAGFTGVRGQEPSYITGLDERGAVKHDASKEIWKRIFVASKGCKWSGPESVWSCGKGVAFEGLNCVGRYEFQEAKFAEVGDEDEAVLLEVAEGLRLGGESVEVIVGRLDFHDAALGVL